MFVLEAARQAQLAFGTGGSKSVELFTLLGGLREELSGLEFLIGHELERNVVEGDGHTSHGAIVLVLARRY